MGKRKGIPSFSIKVVRGDEIIPWEDIPREEQIELSKKWNLRAMQAVARRHGYIIEEKKQESKTL